MENASIESGDLALRVERLEREASRSARSARFWRGFSAAAVLAAVVATLAGPRVAAQREAPIPPGLPPAVGPLADLERLYVLGDNAINFNRIDFIHEASDEAGPVKLHFSGGETLDLDGPEAGEIRDVLKEMRILRGTQPPAHGEPPAPPDDGQPD